MTDQYNDNYTVMSSIGNASSGTGSPPAPTTGSELLKQDPYQVANNANISGPIPGTVLMDVLASIQGIIPDVISSISDIVGFMCEIYYPFGTSSIYGKHDNKIRYSSKPQVRKCFIGANLFAQANIGVFDGSEFSTFLGDVPYLMSFNYKIPENSKVKIYYGSSFRWMKVRYHQAQDGANAPLIIFNMLSPCTSSGEVIDDDPLPTEEDPIVVDPENAEGTVKAGQNLI